MKVYVLTYADGVLGVYSSIEAAACAIDKGNDLSKFHTICAHFEQCGRFGKWTLMAGSMDTPTCGEWNLCMVD